MATYILLFFSLLWSNVSPFSSIQAATSSPTFAFSPKSDGINRAAIIRQALVKTYENLRRRIGWWSELLTITAIAWGVGALLKVSGWLLGWGAWSDYVSTLLFVGGGVFFLIWFFQMAASLD